MPPQPAAQTTDAPQPRPARLERLGIAGSGAIACGVAASAASSGHEPVRLWARSAQSAQRARKRLDKSEEGARVEVVTDLHGLLDATFLVEAIVEDHDTKAELLGELSRRVDPQTILSTTTSSLSVSALAQATTCPDRFVGLHVFNPVTRMDLVELVFPRQVSTEARRRAWALCAAMDKTAVEVPDAPGFVVNRLLFPFLFSAVDFQAQTGLQAADIDTCMQLGAGHPMGPLRLLDFVGLDVAKAIGEEIGARIPARLEALVAEGALGRKAGRGFYSY